MSSCPYRCDKLEELKRYIPYELFKEFRVCPFHEYPIEENLK